MIGIWVQLGVWVALCKQNLLNHNLGKNTWHLSLHVDHYMYAVVKENESLN